VDLYIDDRDNDVDERFPPLWRPDDVVNDGVPPFSALDLHWIAHEEQALSLDVYAGEFTVHPVPLELSLNYCSHKCYFCFANLAKPDRKANVPSIMRLLADHEARNTPVARLLQMRYPVLFSNRVDPFALSNYQQSIPILDTMHELGIPVCYQTRGGVGASARALDEALEWLAPAVWYVSFNTMSDDIRAAVEPGAPSIEYRLELVNQLRDLGHRVVVGINPYVPQWLPAPKIALETLAAAGAEGVWMDAIHLNRDQIANITPRERGRLGEDVIELAMRRKPTPDELANYAALHEMAGEVGLPTYSMGFGQRTDFWRPWFETYDNLFPIQQGLINACYDTLSDGDVIGFDTWEAWFEDLPADLPGLDNYIRAKVSGGRLMPALLNSGELHKGMTLQEVLKLIYRNPKIGICPTRQPCFAYAAHKKGDGKWEQLVDENDMPLLVFSRAGFSEYFTEVDGAKAA
jgi:DNA repair photolyase